MWVWLVSMSFTTFLLGRRIPVNLSIHCDLTYPFVHRSPINLSMCCEHHTIEYLVKALPTISSQALFGNRFGLVVGPVLTPSTIERTMQLIQLIGTFRYLMIPIIFCLSDYCTAAYPLENSSNFFTQCTTISHKPIRQASCVNEAFLIIDQKPRMLDYVTTIQKMADVDEIPVDVFDFDGKTSVGSKSYPEGFLTLLLLVFVGD